MTMPIFVLCAHVALARYYRHLGYEAQSLDAWLVRMLRAFQYSKKIFRSFEELLLWQRVIRCVSPEALDSIGVARKAQHIFKTQMIWEQEESSVFIPEWSLWTQTFLTELRHRNGVIRSELASEILPYLHAAAPFIPKKIIYAGFVLIPPLWARLFDALNQLVSCRPWAAHRASIPRHVIFSDPEDELMAMMQWARQQNTQDRQIACLIPQLSHMHHRIARIASDILLKESYIIPHTEHCATWPSVQGAWQWLQLWSQMTWNRSLLELMLTTFQMSTCMEHTLDTRCCVAEVLSDVRSSERIVWPRDEFLSLIELKNQRYPQSTLWSYWQKAQEIETPKGFCSVEIWSVYFNSLLQLIAWRTPHHFQKMCTQWIRLSVWFSHGLIHQDALMWWHQYCVRSPIWHTEHTKPIHFLEPHQACGRLWDAIWWMGAQKESISYGHYRRTMKHTVYSHIHTVSHHIMISSVCADPNTMHSMEHHAVHASEDEIQWIQREPVDPIVPERIIDHHTMPWPSQKFLPHGVETLKTQAVCPFQAFARFRLGLQRERVLCAGLSAKQRGILCHRVLYVLWDTLKDSKGLRACSDEQLDALIARSVSCVLKSLPETHYVLLEAERLKKLMRAWCLFERSRPFFRVLYREYSQWTQIGSLRFAIRIDRIDQLEDGSVWVIDYKTGRLFHTWSIWKDQPLTAVQLPIYALAVQADGMAEAQLNRSSQKLCGLVHEHSPVYSNLRRTHNWNEQCLSWSVDINQVAESFQSGWSAVQPKANACRSCHLQALCRIHSRSTDSSHH